MASGLVEAEGLLPYQMTLGPDSPNISASISSRLFWGKISTHDKLTRQNKAWNCLGTKALLLPIFDLQGLFWNDQCLRLLQKIIKENFAFSKDQLCDWEYQHFSVLTLRKNDWNSVSMLWNYQNMLWKFYLIHFTFWLFKDLSIKMKSFSWLFPFSWSRLPSYLQLNKCLHIFQNP